MVKNRMEFVGSDKVIEKAEREGATVLNTVPENVFTPWPLPLLKRCVEKVRNRKEGEDFSVGPNCMTEFKRLHPRLFELAKATDPGKMTLLDTILDRYDTVRSGETSQNEFATNIIKENAQTK